MDNNKTKNSTKLFFSGVLVLTISNLLIKAIGALFKIPMNQILGDQGMGNYSASYTIYTFFYMVSTAGLPVAISLLVSENRAKGRLKQVKKVFKIALLVFLAVGIVGTAVMILGAGTLSQVMKVDKTYYCIIAIAPTLFFICLSSAYRGYFQGYQTMLPVAVSQLIEALCKLFLGIAFAYYALNRYGTSMENIHIVAAYAVLGLTIGAAIGMLFLLVSKWLFKTEKYDDEYVSETGLDDTTESSGTILKKILLIALPITVSASVMSLTNLIDTFLIQRLLQTVKGFTAAQASSIYGNYQSLCVPLFNMPPYLIYPISYSIVPMIKTAVASGDKKRANLVMESCLRVAVLIGIPCALGMAALAKPILHVLPFRFWSVVSAAPLLTLLAPSTFFICVLSVTNAILQANGLERKPVISMFAGAAVKVISNMILIRFIGMSGTPISTFLCYLTATGLNIHYIVKHIGLKLSFNRIFVRPLICGILCAVTAIGACNVTSLFIADDVKYGYSKNEETGVITITNDMSSAYLHDATLEKDGKGYDVRSDLTCNVSKYDENESDNFFKDNPYVVTVSDKTGETYTIRFDKNGKALVDGDMSEHFVENGTSDLKGKDGKTGTVVLGEYKVPSNGNIVKLYKEDGTVKAEVTEYFNYELNDNTLILNYPDRNGGEIKLRYSDAGDSIYLNDAISSIATLFSIMVAAIVYALLIFVLRAITADDVKLLPKGAKIEKVLRKVKLIS